MIKILIADDEPRIRALIRQHLEHEGYACEEAADGSAALTLLTAGGIDLAILDVMMPEMDGFEVLRQLRRRSSVPVLMLTARGEAEDKFTGFECGADDYLAKPFLPREVLFRVQAILRAAAGWPAPGTAAPAGGKGWADSRLPRHQSP